MTNVPDLVHARVTILGLGLMGGSLALALKGKVASIFAYDPDPNTLRLALERHVVDQVSNDPGNILPQANLVLLCAPVLAILDWIEELPTLHPGRAIVLDIGSTKGQICSSFEGLPERFDPLGGHPMCGKAVSGLENADPDIFHGARYALTPLERTSQDARDLAGELASAIGADPLWLDPVTHDRWVAASSHLPYLLSCALTLATPPETAPLVGPGFRSTSRLATSSPAMMLDVLNTNKMNILAAVGGFRAELDRLEYLLKQDNLSPDLIESLHLAASRQRDLVDAHSTLTLKESQT